MSNITSYSFYFSIFGGAAYLLFLATSQHAMSDVNPCLDLRPIPETSYNVKFWQHGNMATWQDGKMQCLHPPRHTFPQKCYSTQQVLYLQHCFFPTSTTVNNVYIVP